MLGIIFAMLEALLEIVVLMIIIAVPFVLIGLVCELIRRIRGKYHYEMGTRRQKIHRKLYGFLRKLGYDSDTAYNMATQITSWR